MRIKCDYCGEYMEDTDVNCKNCGAANEHLMRSADGIPKTIDELLAFCKSKNLPLEQMRFFIGIDYKEPKAFGFANNNWKSTYDVSDNLEDNYPEYYKGNTYSSDYNVKDFKYTDYYKEYQEEKSEEKEDKWNNDWDDDDDWKVDGGGWDAGDTDWDTDWVKIFDIYDYI